MKPSASTLTAILLALVLAIPAFAGGQEDSVTKTFGLTLHGDVPPDQQFTAVYFTQENERPSPENPHPLVQFCGPELQIPEEVEVVELAKRVSEDACEGHGTVYEFEVELPRGAKLFFAYDRTSATDPDEFETFYRSGDGGEELGPEDFEMLNADTTNSAYYRYAGTQSPGMPNTGAGGEAGGGA